MALFGGSRDISLFNSISKELINDIIQTEIGYYKFVLEKTTSNVYGESMGKMYYEPVRIACLIQREDQSWSSDDFGYDLDLKLTIRFLSNQIRADSLKIIIHKKTCKLQENCIITKITSNRLEDTIRSDIIKKAALLDAESKKKKKKS